MPPKETSETLQVANFPTQKTTSAEIPEIQKRHRDSRSWVWLLMILLIALALRVVNLSQLPLWVDEAESSINALSILDSGVPTDRYLGIPVYENTLVLPWSESREYEFKDSSYSDNGLVLYHGWLPLYAIAASFRLFRIEPARQSAAAPQYTTAERRRMTIAARMPGVLFGLASIAGLYLAALRLYGRNGAWVAAGIGSLLAVHITFSQQARYYSATLACNAFAAWSLDAMFRRGGWRDYLAGSVIFTLLFYTHLLGFAILCAVWAISQGYACFAYRSEPQGMSDRLKRCGAFCAAVAVLCAPWVMATGFLRHLSTIPAAWRLMRFPRDLVILRAFASEFGILVIGALLILLLGSAFPRSRLIRRLFRPFRRRSTSFALLYLWLAIGYVAFLFGMPAASLFLARFAMMLLIPVILLISMIVCCFGEILNPKRPRYPAFAAALVFVVISNVIHPLPSATKVVRENRDLESAIRYLKEANLSPSTLIFATPNDHLVLTFYTGMAIQSIAPVRKSFLDSYPGPVLLLEKDNMRLPSFILAPRLMRAAKTAGHVLTEQQALALSCEITSKENRTILASQVAEVEPRAAPIPSWGAAVVKIYEQAERQQIENANWRARSGPPFFKNAYLLTQFDWWNEFFYAFSGASWRKTHPNFGDRVGNARASILGCSDWTAVYSPTPVIPEARP